MHAQAIVETRPKPRWETDASEWHAAMGRPIGAGRSGTDFAIGMRWPQEGIESKDMPEDLPEATRQILQTDGWFNSGMYGDLSGCCKFTHLTLAEFEDACAECGYTDDGWERIHEIMVALAPLGDVRVLVGWSW